MLRRAVPPLVAACAALVAAGCGAGEGAAAGATVRVYAEAPVCRGAARELARARDRAGELRVRLACLPPAIRGGRLDLAAVGVGARRATEDSSAVAYLESPGRATAFASPIVEEAQLPVLVSESGSRAMARVLKALRSAGGTKSPRESVGEALGG